MSKKPMYREKASDGKTMDGINYALGAYEANPKSLERLLVLQQALVATVNDLGLRLMISELNFNDSC